MWAYNYNKEEGKLSAEQQLQQSQRRQRREQKREQNRQRYRERYRLRMLKDPVKAKEQVKIYNQRSRAKAKAIVKDTTDLMAECRGIISELLEMIRRQGEQVAALTEVLKIVYHVDSR
jgi:hypothetical protein